MAKPKKSKLQDASQGQQTDKRNPRKTKGVPEKSKDATKEVASGTSASSSVKKLFVNTAKSQGSSRTLSSRAVGTRSASTTPSRLRNFLSKAKTPKRSNSSPRGKQSSKTSGNIPSLLELEDSELSLPYMIYKLRDQPIERTSKKKSIRIDSSSESEEEEEEKEPSPSDDDYADVQDRWDTSSLSSIFESLKDVSSDKDIRVRFNLLNDIGIVPDWDELSAITFKPATGAESGKDMGTFKPPLDSTSSLSQVEDMTLQSEMNYDHDSSEEPTMTGYDYEATSLTSNEEADWTAQPRIKLPSMPTFMEEPLVSSTDSESQYVQGSIMKAREAHEIVEVYIHEVVDKVVLLLESAEYKLMKSLDKKKLLKQLCAVVEDNVYEKTINENLIKRLTGYHLRHAKYSLITPNTSEAHQRRYQDSLNELDYWLNKEQETEKIISTERERLQKELEEKQSKDERELKRVEDLIKETLLTQRQSTERLEMVMDNIIRQIRKKRNEISKTRYDLIISQHNTAYVIQKLEQAQTIGDGLKLHTYQSAEVEVQQLGRLLSMKIAELQRLIVSFCHKIHTISHLRCRRKLLGRNFQAAKNVHLLLTKKHFELRSRIYKMHVRHNKVLARIEDVRHKSGLMHYPLLLRDYDETEKIVRDRSERVSLLRAHHDSLVAKLEEVELAMPGSVPTISQEGLIK